MDFDQLKSADDRLLKLPRKLKRKNGYLSNDLSPTSFVSVKLYGRLAKKWIAERTNNSDSAFIEQLLRMRKQFTRMITKCKCEFKENDVTDIPADKQLYCRDEVIADNTNISSDESCTDDIVMDPLWKIEVEEDSYEISDNDDENDGFQKNFGKAPYRRECEICHEIVSKGLKKKNHLLSEHFKLYIKCEECNNGSDAEEVRNKNMDMICIDDYLEHMKSTHNIENVKCSYCKKDNVELKEDSCRQHLVKKHVNKLFCYCIECARNKPGDDISERNIIKTVSIRSHLATKHCEIHEKITPCRFCGILITRKCMANHINNKHTENDEQSINNLCDICGKHFVKLKQHKRTVHKNKDLSDFKCNTCGKNFANKWNLTVHSRLHTGEKPFVCDQCGKGFCQNVELRLHTTNKHGPKKRVEKSENARKNQRKHLPLPALQINKESPETSIAQDGFVNSAKAFDRKSSRNGALQNQLHSVLTMNNEGSNSKGVLQNVAFKFIPGGKQVGRSVSHEQQTALAEINWVEASN